MNRKIFEYDNLIKKTERTLFNDGFDFVLGVDEAGRGPGAGALFAACVCFKDNENLPLIFDKLNDSKQISEKTREELFPLIKENSYFSISVAGVDLIEKINILNATLYAMKQSVNDVISKINSSNALVLVDGNRKIKDLNFAQKTIVKGDTLSASIMAASVLAKVARDHYMLDMDKKFPNYNFKKNKGYLTKEHIEAIKKYGVIKEHRLCFLKKILAK